MRIPKKSAKKSETRTSPGSRPADAKQKPGLVRVTPEPVAVIEYVPLSSLKPATINDAIYKPIRPDDPSIIDLAADIKRNGLLEPIVITQDDVIVSGHRRRAGSEVAGLAVVPVRRIELRSTDPNFEEMLVSFNRQRVKGTDDIIREEVIRMNPNDAHNAMLAHQKIVQAKVYQRVEDSGLRLLNVGSARTRYNVTDAKRPMLDAAVAVLEQYRKYWPLTLRQIHYRLLTRNVLRHASKPDSLYTNTLACYFYCVCFARWLNRRGGKRLRRRQ